MDRDVGVIVNSGERAARGGVYAGTRGAVAIDLCLIGRAISVLRLTQHCLPDSWYSLWQRVQISWSLLPCCLHVNQSPGKSRVIQAEILAAADSTSLESRCVYCSLVPLGNPLPFFLSFFLSSFFILSAITQPTPYNSLC